jgi:carboxyl-terminal processing protease
MLKKLLTATLTFLLILAPVFAYAVPLDEFYGIIETQYIEPVDSRALRQITPDELGEFLGDPHSAYYTPEKFRYFMENYVGDGGVGIQIYEDGNEIKILLVHPDSPAAKAGLLAGDVIVSVDGTAVAGMSLLEVADLIRGAEGTSVTLELQRGTLTMRRILVRKQLETSTVLSESMGDIAYLSLYAFTDSTPAQFRRSLADLRATSPRGYILDLRDNPGGILDAVLKITEEFLPAGPMIIVRDRYGTEEAYGNMADGEALPNLVVLVNENSASGAEVLAGAIQDYGAGVILGEPTFGKASVQTVFMLSDGSGLKLTTARYATPGGQEIDKIGLSPDVAVSGYEDQLETAIHLIRSTTRTIVFRIGSETAWTTAGNRVSDVSPFIENGRSYVPIRLLAETMGAYVNWDPVSRAVTLEKEDTTLTISTNGGTSLLNGEAYTMETPLIRGDRTFLPARAVANALGGQVWWDANVKEVVVAW